MASMKIKNVTVKYAGVDENNKTTLSVILSPEQVEEIKSKISEQFPDLKPSWIPLKYDKEDNALLKTITNYTPKFYENAHETEDIGKVASIGKGGVIDIFFTMKETRFHGETGVTAYLKAVNILEYGEATPYNPFE
jgi:hypothetical protein